MYSNFTYIFLKCFSTENYLTKIENKNVTNMSFTEYFEEVGLVILLFV